MKPLKLVKLLSPIGMVPVRQSKGPHLQLAGTHKGLQRHTTIPLHMGTLSIGVLKQALDDCGLTGEEFFKLLH